MAMDSVSDLLTKIRNASRSKHPTVNVRAAKFSAKILDVLKREGYIRNFKLMGEPPQQEYRVYLKYGSDHTPAISQIVRVSKPGRRSYRGSAELPRVLGGIGKAILTTSKGVVTDQEAYRQKIGGEVLCYVW